MNIKDNIKKIIFNNNEENILVGGNNENNSESENKNENNNEIKSINFSNKNSNDNKNENQVKSINFSNENENENKNINENQVKSVNFSNKNNNESVNFSNENNESIFFSNNEQENNITKFFSGNQNLVIEEEVAIKEQDFIYKNDIIYLKELENQLLSEYPVTKQREKYIQLIVENNSKKIIEIKNIGIKVNEMLKNNIEYKLIDDIINDNFISNYIIPIVLDKHKIYVKLEEDQNENINALFSESFENKDGIIEINQKTQMIELKELYHNLSLQKINYKDYLNKVQNIIRPYNIIENNNGYIKKYKNHNSVLRYNDYNSIYWNIHNSLSDFNSVKDIFDESGKIIGTEPYPLIEGDTINIVGFMTKNDKYLDKEFKQSGIITKITNSSNNNIKVEIINHGLIEKDNNIIYISDSNCFPKINNVYRKSVKIIDKDNIEITIHEKLLKEGNYGILHTISNLDYTLHEIKKDNNIISISKNNIQSTKKNNIYLFDKLSINKNDYEYIIKNILPSLDEIINDNITKLNKCYSFDDIDSILKKYYININSLHIKQIEIIKQIFRNNLNKIIINDDVIKININKYNKEYLKDNTYFLSDIYITNKELTKYYNEYIHINKPEDNLLLRLKWLLSQKDNGEYYLLNYSLIINKNSKNSKLFINDKINNLSSLLENIQKNFKKEKNSKNSKNKLDKLYNYQAIRITSENDIKNIDENINIFYDNILYRIKSGKLEIIKDIDENSLLLIDNTILIWKKNKWENSNIVPKYNNIKYLCELNNIDISDLQLDSLDCIYRKDIGCKSKSYIRLEETIEKLNIYLSDFKKLLEHTSKNKNIYQKINYLKEKFYNGRNIKHIVKKENINIKPNSEPIIDNLSVLLNLIKKINNYNTKLNSIYSLIEIDGILIDKDIYSKKYLRKMNICGHYYFFKKINYTNDPNTKILLTDIMQSIYGDDGESEKNYITCKNCGEILINNEYDDTEGFSETGMIKKSREVWSVELVDKKYDQQMDLLSYIKSTNIEDKAFKEILIKHGISIEDVEDAIKISIFIVKNLFMKAGIILPNTELITIIVDCMQKIKRIIPYRMFKAKEIKKYQEKGFSQEYIDNMDSKDIFKNEYIKNIQIKKNCIISARFLISAQITVPTLVRSSKDTICPYFSFYGDDGLSYMACILEEMQIISYSDKTKIRDILKLTLLDEYNEFKKLAHIQKLFKIRKEYELELSKKKQDFKFISEVKNRNIVYNEKNNINFNNEIEKSKNIEQLKKIRNKLVNKLKYLTYTIENTVENVIANSYITDQYVGLVEVSCCMEYADSYLDYYYYIEEESKSNIKKIIDESKLLFNDTYYFINSGSIHKFILYNKNKFNGIYNNIIIDNDENTRENVIKAVFEFFVDSGEYAGTKREYIGDINNPIDFKSGFSKKEILSRNYTIEEYQRLLKNIEKHNIKYYIPVKDVFFDDIEITDMKKTSNDKLEKEINTLVNNISTVLNKDSKFKDKYLKLIRNFGIFDIEKDIEKLTNKERIKYRENLNARKMNYIKKFYISKLKKYLSIIKNYKSPSNIDIGFELDKDIKIEIQKNIYTENKRLEIFLNESIRKYFLDLETKYSNDEINSINGIADIYNSSYEDIKKYSDFNFNDASNVLLYILISELNSFIYCNSKNNSQKCKYICNFILILFDDLDYDNEIFNICETSGIKNSMIHDIIEYKEKNIFKKKEEGISLLQSLLKETKSIDYLGEKLDQDEIENDYNDEYKDKIEFIMEKGKKDLYDKYGYEPTDDQLENYKNSYLEDMQEAEDVDSFGKDAKGKEVLDQGADYGGFNEFDFETGDGFDYSDEME